MSLLRVSDFCQKRTYAYKNQEPDNLNKNKDELRKEEYFIPIEIVYILKYLPIFERTCNEHDEYATVYTTDLKLLFDLRMINKSPSILYIASNNSRSKRWCPVLIEYISPEEEENLVKFTDEGSILRRSMIKSDNCYTLYIPPCIAGSVGLYSFSNSFFDDIFLIRSEGVNMYHANCLKKMIPNYVPILKKKNVY